MVKRRVISHKKQHWLTVLPGRMLRHRIHVRVADDVQLLKGHVRGATKHRNISDLVRECYSTHAYCLAVEWLVEHPSEFTVPMPVLKMAEIVLLLGLIDSREIARAAVRDIEDLANYCAECLAIT
jgi:hypothetical protein